MFKPVLFAPMQWLKLLMGINFRIFILTFVENYVISTMLYMILDGWNRFQYSGYQSVLKQNWTEKKYDLKPV